MIAENIVASKSSIHSGSQEALIQQHGAKLQTVVDQLIGGV